MMYSIIVPAAFSLIGLVLADCPYRTVQLNSTQMTGCIPCPVGIDNCATINNSPDKIYAIAW